MLCASSIITYSKVVKIEIQKYHCVFQLNSESIANARIQNVSVGANLTKVKQKAVFLNTTRSATSQIDLATKNGHAVANVPIDVRSSTSQILEAQQT